MRHSSQDSNHWRSVGIIANDIRLKKFAFRWQILSSKAFLTEDKDSVDQILLASLLVFVSLLSTVDESV